MQTWLVGLTKKRGEVEHRSQYGKSIRKPLSLVLNGLSTESQGSLATSLSASPTLAERIKAVAGSFE